VLHRKAAIKVVLAQAHASRRSVNWASIAVVTDTHIHAAMPVKRRTRGNGIEPMFG